MKILIIVNEFPPEVIAGTALSTFCLSGHLARRGHDVHVAVTDRGLNSPRTNRLRGVTVHRLKPVGLKGTRSLQRLVGLYRLARAVAPDIIQGQALSCGALAALIGCALKTPSITCIQGFDLYRASALQKCVELRTALRGSSCVLAVTDELKALAAAISGRRDIVVIPHGLEPAEDIDAEVDRLRQEIAGLPQRRVLLYVGQLHERKGLTELLDAMQRVHAAAPDVALVLVGRGPLEGDLRRQARRVGLENVLHFMGPRPHSTVMAFMRLADVFVLPSREEPFGIVLIEAMSQGLPVVATEVQHIPHLIRPGVNGSLSAPGDTDGLAKNILRMFADPDEAAAIGRRNREEASRYDWKLLAARYERIYAESRRRTHAEAA